VAEAGGTTVSSENRSPANVPPLASLGDHHHIATNHSNPINLFTFLREHDGDLAVKVGVSFLPLHFSHNGCQNFIPRLKDHILYRLQKLDVSHCDHIFTDEEHNSVIIPNHIVYSVQTMQVHYTTYDLRREYNTINPQTHADIMVLLGETTPSHPYWYVRILGIYHLETWIKNADQPVKQHLEVLWVRWLAPLRSHKSGMKCAHLLKVVFVDESDTDAFGFLDPNQVI
jgi:hypothetical protein